MSDAAAHLLKHAIASEQFPRHSEGCLFSLKNGELLYVWTRKVGGCDFEEGEIIALRSCDGGVTWDGEPQVIQRIWPGIFDVMCPSLVETERGIHHFFAGRVEVEAGAEKGSARLDLFQTFSNDGGRSWSAPEKINQREGYNVINNARVKILDCGRIIAPVAFVPGSIFKEYNTQVAFCYYSDDSGRSWQTSASVSLPDAPLMEPGVEECADGSLYMILRTKLGCLYESRSLDKGGTWSAPRPTLLKSAEAPATLFRRPSSDTLWVFWCNTPYVPGEGMWFQRHHVAWAFSTDNGRSWSEPELIEHDPGKSFAYITANQVGDNVIVTYYHWPLADFLARNYEAPFVPTSIVLRRIPLDWFLEREGRGRG